MYNAKGFQVLVSYNELLWSFNDYNRVSVRKVFFTKISLLDELQN